MKQKLFSTLLVQVYLPGFIMFVGWSMAIPVIPLLARELGATVALAGFVVAIKGIGPLVLNLPSGMLITRLGNRAVVLISCIVSLIIAVATGFAGSVWVLALLSFIMDGARTAWMLTRVDFVRSLVPTHQRGRAISAVGGINRIGGFVGPIIGGIVGKYLGLHSVFFVQAGIIGLVLAILLIGRRQKRQDVRAEIPKGSAAGIGLISRLLRDHRKSYLTVGVVALVFQLLRAGRSVVYPLWGESIGLDVAEIGLIMGLISALDMTMFLPAGLIMDRKGRKWTAVPSLIIMSLSFLFLPLAHSFAVLLIVGLLNGLGNGLGSGIVMTLGSDLAPQTHAGEFLGIWFVISGLGGLIGPAVIGIMSDLLSMGAASITTAGLGLLGGLFLLFFAKETRNRQPDSP